MLRCGEHLGVLDLKVQGPRPRPGPLLIEIHLDAWDVPEPFKQMGAHMGRE